MIELNRNTKEIEKEKNTNSLSSQQSTLSTKSVISIKIGHRTKQGVLASNPKKQNQDSFIILENIKGSKTTHFFAVCDGHGTVGHHVSGYVKQFLPLLIENDIKVSINLIIV